MAMRQQIGRSEEEMNQEVASVKHDVRCTDRFKPCGWQLAAGIVSMWVGLRLADNGLYWLSGRSKPSGGMSFPSMPYLFLYVLAETVLTLLVLAPLTLLTWNLLVSRAFGVPRITYWHALVIVLLGSLAASLT